MPKKILPSSLPAPTSVDRLAAHRRLMAEKGRAHLERIAASAAGARFEPLPKRERARKKAW